jgi:hypothetical protein
MGQSVRHVFGLGAGEPRSSEYNGSKALMMAVLEGGIRDYCGAPGRRCREAEYWVQSGRREAFSFAVICETLELEPTAVRQALVRLKDQSGLPPGRIRPDVRTQRPTAKSPR